MKIKTQRGFKIISVQIEKKLDQSPDTSHLGEYTSQPMGLHVNRETHELIDSGGNVLATNAPSSSPERHSFEFIHGLQHNSDARWTHVSDLDVSRAYIRARYHVAKSNWKIPFRVNRFAEFGIIGWDNATTRQAKIRCLNALYCCEDIKRLETLNNGDWHYVGIIAKAQVQSPTGIIQWIRSGGLWGVESDSDPEYLKSVSKEELDSLKAELEALGIGQRAIAYAFKNVTTAKE